MTAYIRKHGTGKRFSPRQIAMFHRLVHETRLQDTARPGMKIALPRLVHRKLRVPARLKVNRIKQIDIDGGGKAAQYPGNLAMGRLVAPRVDLVHRRGVSKVQRRHKCPIFFLTGLAERLIQHHLPVHPDRIGSLHRNKRTHPVHAPYQLLEVTIHFLLRIAVQPHGTDYFIARFAHRPVRQHPQRTLQAERRNQQVLSFSSPIQEREKRIGKISLPLRHRLFCHT